MLLSVVRKVLTSVITTRWTGFMQTYVRDYQAGFRPDHSTILMECFTPAAFANAPLSVIGSTQVPC